VSLRTTRYGRELAERIILKREEGRRELKSSGPCAVAALCGGPWTPGVRADGKNRMLSEVPGEGGPICNELKCSTSRGATTSLGGEAEGEK